VRIRMQEGDSSSKLSHASWDIGVIGSTVDQRGEVACDFITQNCGEVMAFDYNPDDFTLRVGDRRINLEEVEHLCAPWVGMKVIFEATTLGFVEILLCLRALRKLLFAEVSFLYVEPSRYKTSRERSPLHRRDFELSDEVPGYRGIPGFTLMMSDRLPQRAVFFLGYEEPRLDRALEDFQMLNPSSCSAVFGVPAFQPGWEMDAFSNNIRVIRERHIVGGVYFCGAENPAAALDVLNQIRSELTNGERQFIAPIGTKPHGLAAALFATTNPDVGILYDHPKRSKGRSEKVARWHLFEVEFS
jgi:hypothetical protein